MASKPLEMGLNIIHHQRNANKTAMRHHCKSTTIAKLKGFDKVNVSKDNWTSQILLAGLQNSTSVTATHSFAVFCTVKHMSL